ncbi:MAG: 50S ribosomal protein L10 [Candidatus Pacearchaeota archaeon]|jgi:large subunit ribosomal protein L10
MPRIKKSSSEHKRAPPKYKVELVKGIVKLIESHNTIMLVSIKSLPSRQFQKIKKDLSKDTQVIIAKKRMVNLAIDESKKENLKDLKEYVREDVAVLISQVDAFELSARLADSKSPVKAKVGQIAEADISVEAGPTDLAPGPVVSELGGLGLKIEIKAGKIEIKEAKVIVKKDQAISEGAVSIMSKLNITPFSVGLTPIAAYDSKDKKVFSDLVIDKKSTLITLREMFSKSVAFAVSQAYVCKETLSYLLARASSHEQAIANLVGSESNDNAPKNTEESI